MGSGQSKMCCFPFIGPKGEEQRPIVKAEHTNYDTLPANEKARTVLGIDHDESHIENIPPADFYEEGERTTENGVTVVKIKGSVKPHDIEPGTSDSVKESKIPVRLGAKGGKSSTESTPPSDAETKANEYLKQLEGFGDDTGHTTEDYHPTAENDQPLGEGIRDDYANTKINGESISKGVVPPTRNANGDEIDTIEEITNKDDIKVESEKPVSASAKFKDFFKEVFPKPATGEEDDYDKSVDDYDKSVDESPIKEDKEKLEKESKELEPENEDNIPAKDGEKESETIGDKFQGLFKGILPKGSSKDGDKYKEDNQKEEKKANDEPDVEPSKDEDYLQREGIEENMDRNNGIDEKQPEHIREDNEEPPHSLGNKFQGFFKGMMSKGDKDKTDKKDDTLTKDETIIQEEIKPEEEKEVKTSRIPTLFGRKSTKDQPKKSEESTQENDMVEPKSEEEKTSQIPMFFGKKTSGDRKQPENSDIIHENIQNEGMDEGKTEGGDIKTDSEKQGSTVGEKMKNFFKEAFPKSSEGNEEGIDSQSSDDDFGGKNKVHDQNRVEDGGIDGSEKETQTKISDDNIQGTIAQGSKENIKDEGENVDPEKDNKSEGFIPRLLGKKGNDNIDKPPVHTENNDETKDLDFDKPNKNVDAEKEQERSGDNVSDKIKGFFKEMLPKPSDGDEEGIDKSFEKSNKEETLGPKDNVKDQNEVDDSEIEGPDKKKQAGNFGDKVQDFFKGIVPQGSKENDKEDDEQEKGGDENVDPENDVKTAADQEKKSFIPLFGRKVAKDKDNTDEPSVSTDNGDEIKDLDIDNTEDTLDSEKDQEKSSGNISDRIKGFFKEVLPKSSEGEEGIDNSFEESNKEELVGPDNDIKDQNAIKDSEITGTEKQAGNFGDKFQKFFKGIGQPGSKDNDEKVDKQRKVDNENVDLESDLESKPDQENKGVMPVLFGKKGVADNDNREEPSLTTENENGDEIKDLERDDTRHTLDSEKDQGKSGGNVSNKIKGFFNEVLPKSSEGDEEGIDKSFEESNKEESLGPKDNVKDQNEVDDSEIDGPDKKKQAGNFGDKVQGFFKRIVPQGSKDNDKEDDEQEKGGDENVDPENDVKTTADQEKKSFIPLFGRKVAKDKDNRDEPSVSTVNGDEIKDLDIDNTEHTLDLEKDQGKSSGEGPDKKKQAGNFGDKVQNFFKGIVPQGSKDNDKEDDDQEKRGDENVDPENDVKTTADQEKKSFIPLFGRKVAKDKDNRDEPSVSTDNGDEIKDLDIDNTEHTLDSEKDQGKSSGEGPDKKKQAGKFGDKVENFFKGIVPQGSKDNDKEDDDQEKGGDENVDPENDVKTTADQEKKSFIPLFGRKVAKDKDNRDEPSVSTDNGDEIKDLDIDNTEHTLDSEKDQEKSSNNISDRIKGFFKEVLPKSSEGEEGIDNSFEESNKEELVGPDDDIKDQNAIKDSEITGTEKQAGNFGDKFQKFIKGIGQPGSKDNDEKVDKQRKVDNENVDLESDLESKPDQENKGVMPVLFGKKGVADNDNREEPSPTTENENGDEIKDLERDDTRHTLDSEKDQGKSGGNVSNKIKGFFNEVLPKSSEGDEEGIDKSFEESNKEESLGPKDNVKDQNEVDDSEIDGPDKKKQARNFGDKVQDFFKGIVPQGSKDNDKEDDEHEKGGDENVDPENDVKTTADQEKKSFIPLFGRKVAKDKDNRDEPSVSTDNGDEIKDLDIDNSKQNIDSEKDRVKSGSNVANKIKDFFKETLPKSSDGDEEGVDKSFEDSNSNEGEELKSKNESHDEIEDDTIKEKQPASFGDKVQEYFKGIGPHGSEEKKNKPDDLKKVEQDNLKMETNDKSKSNIGDQEKTRKFPSIFGGKKSKSTDHDDTDTERNNQTEAKNDLEAKENKEKVGTNISEKFKGVLKEVLPKSTERNDEEGSDASSEDLGKETKEDDDSDAKNLENNEDMQITKNNDKLGDRVQGFFKGMLPKTSKKKNNDQTEDGNDDNQREMKENEDYSQNSNVVDVIDITPDDITEEKKSNVSGRMKDFFKEILPKPGVSEEVEEDDINDEDKKDDKLYNQNESHKTKVKESRIPVIFGKKTKKEDNIKEPGSSEQQNPIEMKEDKNDSLEQFKQSLQDTANVHQLLADSLANLSEHENDAEDESEKDNIKNDDSHNKIPVKEMSDEDKQKTAPGFKVTVIKGNDEEDVSPNEHSDNVINGSDLSGDKIEDIDDNEDHAMVLPGGKIITDDMDKEEAIPLRSSVPPPSRIPRLSDSKSLGKGSTDLDSNKREPKDNAKEHSVGLENEVQNNNDNLPSNYDGFNSDHHLKLPGQQEDGMNSQASDDTGIEDDMHSTPSDDTIVEENSSILKPGDDSENTLTNENDIENRIATGSPTSDDNEHYPEQDREGHDIEDGIDNLRGQGLTKEQISPAFAETSRPDDAKHLLPPKDETRGKLSDENSLPQNGDENKEAEGSSVGPNGNDNIGEEDGIDLTEGQKPATDHISPGNSDTQKIEPGQIIEPKSNDTSQNGMDNDTQNGLATGSPITDESDHHPDEDREGHSIEDGIDNIRGQGLTKEQISPAFAGTTGPDDTKNVLPPEAKARDELSDENSLPPNGDQNKEEEGSSVGPDGNDNIGEEDGIDLTEGQKPATDHISPGNSGTQKIEPGQVIEPKSNDTSQNGMDNDTQNGLTTGSPITDESDHHPDEDREGHSIEDGIDNIRGQGLTKEQISPAFAATTGPDDTKNVLPPEAKARDELSDENSLPPNGDKNKEEEGSSVGPDGNDNIGEEDGIDLTEGQKPATDHISPGNSDTQKIEPGQVIEPKSNDTSQNGMDNDTQNGLTTGSPITDESDHHPDEDREGHSIEDGIDNIRGQGLTKEQISPAFAATTRPDDTKNVLPPEAKARDELSDENSLPPIINGDKNKEEEGSSVGPDGNDSIGEEDGIDLAEGQKPATDHISPGHSDTNKIEPEQSIEPPKSNETSQNDTEDDHEQNEEPEEVDDSPLWDDVLNTQLLADGNVNHAAMIDIGDAENVKAANFQPSIRGVKSLIEALDGNTEAIEEDGLLLGSTEYPYPFTPKKIVKGQLIHAVTPDGEKDCTVYKTKRHIIISTYLNNVHNKAVKRVQDVAKYIQKNLEA